MWRSRTCLAPVSSKDSESAAISDANLSFTFGYLRFMMLCRPIRTETFYLHLRWADSNDTKLRDKNRKWTKLNQTGRLSGGRYIWNMSWKSWCSSQNIGQNSHSAPGDTCSRPQVLAGESNLAVFISGAAPSAVLADWLSTDTCRLIASSCCLLTDTRRAPTKTIVWRQNGPTCDQSENHPETCGAQEAAR